MKVKQKPYQYPEWKMHPVRNMQGQDLVHYALQNEHDEQCKLEKLAAIVGRLVELAPKDERLAICGIAHCLELVE